MGNLYLLEESVFRVFALCIPLKHGSELPYVHAFSDFVDFLSDMSWEGNYPLCFQIITVKQRWCIYTGQTAATLLRIATRLTLATVFCVS